MAFDAISLPERTLAYSMQDDARYEITLLSQKDIAAVAKWQIKRSEQGVVRYFERGESIIAMRMSDDLLATCYRKVGEPDCFWMLTRSETAEQLVKKAANARLKAAEDYMREGLARAQDRERSRR